MKKTSVIVIQVGPYKSAPLPPPLLGLVPTFPMEVGSLSPSLLSLFTVCREEDDDNLMALSE